ncbi:MAG: hypothetical protein RL734_383 [Bacteroidota bacterium]
MLFSSCTNPFAPKLSDTPLGENVFADQKTVDGIFQNFRSAYLYKDTLAYGRLLDKDFIFIYRNYETGVDGTWGRDQDMFTTSGLFNATQNLDPIGHCTGIQSHDYIQSARHRACSRKGESAIEKKFNGRRLENRAMAR